MAEKSEGLVSLFLTFSIEDKSFDFSLCSWNINGKAVAGCRKKVLNDTFSCVLQNCKLVCLQEVPFDPRPGGIMKEYIPQISSGYGVVQSKEGHNSIYNAVLFQEESFENRSNDYTFTTAIENAFLMMEEKRKFYLHLSFLDDASRSSAIEVSYAPQKMKEEVSTECKECGFNVAAERFFLQSILKLDRIVKERVAFSCLKAKLQADYFLIVMSVHFPRNQKDANNFAYLLLDFLEKVDFPGPILIAGDFNFDIARDQQNLRRFLENYYIPHYDLKPLRDNKRIDFIMCKWTTWLAVTNVSAHDFIVCPEIEQILKGEDIDPLTTHRKVTNHNPLTADLIMYVKVKHTPLF